MNNNCDWSEVNDFANLYLQQEKWLEAITAYYRVIELNPSFFWSHHNLGDVLMKLERWDEAAVRYSSAIELDPKFFWSHHNLGDVLMKLERWDEAAVRYSSAIELDPNFFWSHHNLGDVLMKLARWDEAIAAYFNAIQLDANAALINQKLGMAFFKRGNLTESIQYYRQVIRHSEPDSTYNRLKECSALLRRIGNNLAQEHQILGAIVVYYMLLEIEPDHLAILPSLEKLLQKHNQLEQNIVAFQQQMQNNPGRLSYYQSNIHTDETNINDKSNKEKFLFTSDRQIDPYELQSLFEAVGWHRRPLDKVQKALTRSFLVVAIWEISNSPHQLIGFARVVSDSVFDAIIWDMMIHPDFQGRGLGKKSIEYLVTKLRAEGIQNIILFASPSVADFYHSLGFISEPNNLKLMLWSA
ncbi:MAG: GNAT family N-acetyltransferase [Gomphosphaeria aponina SAG 52.96 = DSM 107014]|uniref:GNAT family N-acetyltransferase n=1 Tax=Gomphosphaeria aponina SAG 52.96 = DSM 107014 TaxID=1521640 RepID=A0A941JUB2_9CHRO|nr:GNAT family N-acetyltransferase [Gomphosphaeria aponina SAG 52.96 = DSM 107014]